MTKGTKPEIIPVPEPGMTDVQHRDCFRRFLQYALDLAEKPGFAGSSPAVKRDG